MSGGERLGAEAVGDAAPIVTRVVGVQAPDGQEDVVDRVLAGVLELVELGCLLEPLHDELAS